MTKEQSSYEDLQENIRNIELPAIEAFKNKYPDRDYEVNLSSPEFTCICPKTGLPDFGTIIVTYCPNEVCVELKSFKLYLVAFRNVGIFHENVVNRVLDDFVKACNPRWAKVESVVMPRGGITTTVVAEYKDDK
ncbi:MAG: 7-cyano-7-deazaguanine reductase [Lysobacterales bacterium]|jgi:7-cyano-7-deazaguanine reductase